MKNKLRKFKCIKNISLALGLVSLFSYGVIGCSENVQPNVYVVDQLNEHPIDTYNLSEYNSKFIDWPYPVSYTLDNGSEKSINVSGILTLTIGLDNSNLYLDHFTANDFLITYTSSLVPHRSYRYNPLNYTSNFIGTRLYNVENDTPYVYSFFFEAEFNTIITNELTTTYFILDGGSTVGEISSFLFDIVDYSPVENITLDNLALSSSLSMQYNYKFIYDYIQNASNYYSGYYDGITEVQDNPNSWGLHTDEELEASYNKGFQEGADATLENNGFMFLIQSVFSAPVSMFREAFNFEIFGINVANLVALLLTIGLVILVVGIFKGKNGG